MEEQIQKIKRNNRIRIGIIIVALILLLITVNMYEQSKEFSTTLGLSIILFILTIPLVYITIMACIKIATLKKLIAERDGEDEHQQEENEVPPKQTCKYCGCKMKDDVCHNCGAKITE